MEHASLLNIYLLSEFKMVTGLGMMLRIPFFRCCKTMLVRAQPSACARHNKKSFDPVECTHIL
jgi:hypothetical protein